MTSENPHELDPAEIEAYRDLIERMSIEELQELKADPEALQGLAMEARLRIALEELDEDQVVAAANSYYEETYGRVFTAAEWALIFEEPPFRHLATNPTERAKFELAMRQDPDLVRTWKRTMADVLSERESALSPMAKQWLLRIGIGLVIGLFLIAQNQK